MLTTDQVLNLKHKIHTILNKHNMTVHHCDIDHTGDDYTFQFRLMTEEGNNICKDMTKELEELGYYINWDTYCNGNDWYFNVSVCYPDD